MNIWVWGPPKWRFLHSLSFSPSVHEYPAESSAFLETLEEVLPCIYCRESYKTFLPRLEGEFGMTLEQVVAEDTAVVTPHYLPCDRGLGIDQLP